MAQRDGYQIDGRSLGNYYWTGAKGERRAASSAYADSTRDEDRYGPNNPNYMRDVARGGQIYDQARMRQDAEAQEDAYRTQRRKPQRQAKRTPPKSAVKRK